MKCILWITFCPFTKKLFLKIIIKYRFSHQYGYWDTALQFVEKPTGYHNELSPSRCPKAKHPPRGHNPGGLWPRDLLRDSIQHDTPKAFQHSVILLWSRTSIWDFSQPMHYGEVQLNKRHSELSIPIQYFVLFFCFYPFGSRLMAKSWF